MMEKDILEICGLKKSFGEKKVLRGVDFSVPENSVFGFIGRNGAGKTTTMKSVLGLLKPDSGEIRVCGETVTYGQTKTNRFIGYLPDVPEFYPFMTAKEYLKLCGQISGMSASEIKSRSEELLELVGLGNEKHRIKGYSRGMKQRLGIAQALMGRPKLLICDEPTSALDPVGRKEILEILLAARAQTSVLFSTHILSDVEKICDHVALLEGGKIVAVGTMDEVRGMHADPGIEIVLKDLADEERIRKAFPNVIKRYDDRKKGYTENVKKHPETSKDNNRRIKSGKTDLHATKESSGDNYFQGTLYIKNVSDDTAGKILEFLAKEHIPIIRFERKEADLEEMFMEFIGE
ncbi:MAG: ABC transporter ATP-binding protein [Lachnospiraceae bacterium]|nr:ABC transporter ATP-binding protein [Lachnospiraceae bacterium]